MKNIYECYECEPSTEFQLLTVDEHQNVLWMAPDSGDHDVSEIITQHGVGQLQWVIIPPDSEVTGLLWSETVPYKGRPGSLAQAGSNTIIEQQYSYGVFIRL
jgi:hypothetical protein